jgi:hypothetical protein
LVRHAPPTGSRHPRMHLPSCRECHRLRIPHHQRAHSSVIPQHERRRCNFASSKPRLDRSCER